MSPQPQLLVPALPPCSACGRPARVLLALHESPPLCPSCSRADGVELATSRDLSASLALRLASAPTRDMHRRPRRLSEQEKRDMIANLDRLLAGVSRA